MKKPSTIVYQASATVAGVRDGSVTLAFSGALVCGPMVENEPRNLATNVESLIIPDCGHFPAEEQPEALLIALLKFFTSPAA